MQVASFDVGQMEPLQIAYDPSASICKTTVSKSTSGLESLYTRSLHLREIQMRQYLMVIEASCTLLFSIMLGVSWAFRFTLDREL